LTRPAALDPSDSWAPAESRFQTLARGLDRGRFRTRPLETGMRVHHYEVLNPLGMGGMSTIYRARHVYLDHLVALKTVRGDLLQEEVAARFLREAVVLARLNHPCVVRALDGGYHDDVPYMITELLDGRSLRSTLDDTGRLTIPESLDVLEQVASVLVVQERLGIVHRDIKPGNLQQRSNGRTCLLDYGLSDYGDGRAGIGGPRGFETGAGHLVGTPGYMAPEQVLGGATDHRVDLYGLGVTVWECLAGRPARQGSSVSEILAEALRPVPPIATVRAEVPRGLDTILASLTAVDPEERYATAVQLLEDLQEFRYGGRRPNGAVAGSAFLAIPFTRRFDAVCDALADACLRARLAPRRIDRLTHVSDIWGQIAMEIKTSTAVVADFSVPSWCRRGPNPNVVTEAAHARALDKPLVLLTRGSPEHLPFDWRHVPVLRYRDTPGGRRALTDDLAPRLQHLLAFDDRYGTHA
jgi:serine/threonine protein kinase